MLEAASVHVPFGRGRPGSKPGWNDECQAALREIELARSELLATTPPSEQAKHRLATARQQLQHSLATGRRRAWQAFVERLTHLHGETHRLFRVARAMQGKRRTPSCCALRHPSGRYVHSVPGALD